MYQQKKGLSRQKQLVRILAIALPFLFLIIQVSNAIAQQPSPSPQPPKNLPINRPSTPSGIATGEVWLDGRKLFSVAAPTVQDQANQTSDNSPVQERIKTIEKTLSEIANSPIDPDQLKVITKDAPENGLPIIELKTGNSATQESRYLLTVTNLDAQLQAEDLEQRAKQLSQIIESALKRARRERQPKVLAEQSWQAVQIGLAMVIVSWLVSRVQRYFKNRKQRIDSQSSVSPDQDSSTPLQPQEDGTAITPLQAQMFGRLQVTLNQMQRRLLHLVQFGIWASGSFIILGLFPYTRWLQPLILSGPLKVLGIILLTYVAIRVSDFLIDRTFAILTAETPIAPDTSQRLSLRVSTFSRVLHSVIGFLLISTGVLSILSVLGIELGPVLAGAGILGLAISFGSQNLIKDVINGFFILLEDQYAVGDVIEVGQVGGLVESMNLRITQLRNAEGRLITIPNSAITIVENLSKDWSRVDLGITLAYDVDVDRALEVIKQVGHEMNQDPLWDKQIAEDPKVLGVDAIDNTGVTIRIWIKTLPLEQWNVAREFRRRMKHALDEAGIAIGVPQQSLWFRSTEGADQPPVNPNGKPVEQQNCQDG
jgi:small conductance mechanosensitive channel